MSTAQRKMSKTTKNNTNEKYKKRPKQKKKGNKQYNGETKTKIKGKKKDKLGKKPHMQVYMGNFVNSLH